MAVNWEESWNTLREDFLTVRREMDALNDVLSRRDASGWQRADALVGAARALCDFLRRAKGAGVFEDIASAADNTDQFRELLARDIGQVLAEEARVLELAGFADHEARAIIRETAAAMDGTWEASRLERRVFLRRIDAAIDSVCDFPQSALLMRAHDIRVFVRRIDKRFHIAKGVVLVGANAIVATQMPEPISVVKLSKLIALLLAGANTDGDDGDVAPDV